MSYAAVTKDNIPAGEMPQPDQNLRDGALPEGAITNEDVKREVNEAAAKAKKVGREIGDKAKREAEEAENAIAAAWNKTMDVVLRPSFIGGLAGVLNVGILGGLGYVAYQNRNRPWDQRYVAGSIAGVLGLFTVEGLATDSFLQTPEGQAEARRAKAEGSRAYLQAKELILRPSVAGGLAGVVNLAVLGAIGFFANKHWNERWDNRVVAGVAAGLLALTGVEGMLASEYDDKVLHNKRK